MSAREKGKERAKARTRGKANEIGKGAVKSYARFLASYPFFILAIFLIFTVFAGYHASMVGRGGISYEEIVTTYIENYSLLTKRNI